MIYIIGYLAISLVFLLGLYIYKHHRYKQEFKKRSMTGSQYRYLFSPERGARIFTDLWYPHSRLIRDAFAWPITLILMFINLIDKQRHLY